MLPAVGVDHSFVEVGIAVAAAEMTGVVDKELSQITSAMGDSVRLQSINVASIIQANLKAEFALRRTKTPVSIRSKKSFAA